MIPKITRTITSILPVNEARTGACNDCGKCCELPFRCKFLTEDSEGNSRCSIYKIRPLVCRKFPRTEAQLESVKDSCGFAFDKEEEKNGDFVMNNKPAWNGYGAQQHLEEMSYSNVGHKYNRKN
jgi:hypothetical protein